VRRAKKTDVEGMGKKYGERREGYDGRRGTKKEVRDTGTKETIPV
jgi:hypothetical protein